MARIRKVQPTEAELAILQTLWDHGPSTVRQVHELLGGDRRTRYTTTLKQLQVMGEKGLVKRDQSQRSHVYSAVAARDATQQSLVSSFVDRVFDGSVRKMMVHALEAGKVSAEELDELKRLLRQWETTR